YGSMGALRLLSTLGFVAGLALLLNSGYLAARAEPTLFYLSNVAVHTAGGVLLLPLLLLAAWRFRQWCQARLAPLSASLASAGFSFLAIGLLAGVSLLVLGGYPPQRRLPYTPIRACSAPLRAIV